MPKKNSRKTFRLCFVRRRIVNTVRSERLREALMEELDGGQDAALVVQMMERVRERPVIDPPTQAVRPVPIPPPAPQPCPVHGLVQPQPGPAQPQPGPAHPQPQNHPVPPPVPAADGNSRAGAVEILDSDDEFVQDMRLSPRRERRLREQIPIWRSSSSE